MSNLIQDLIDIRKKIHHYHDYFKKINQEYESLISRSSILQEKSSYLYDNSEKYQQYRLILQQIDQQLTHPELILAATGTTSSGKSTLVNMLCGAEIMPEAVGEMSAGCVEIVHSAQKRLIVKKDLRNHENHHLWEKEDILNPSDDEIQNKLKSIMNKYNDHRENNPPLPPSFILYYPIDFFLEFQNLFPNYLTFKILDLPGLKSEIDSQNAEVILNHTKKALCLVTYNSSETNEKKQNLLLNEIKNQVKKLGGSINHMIFILNKIDIFQKDKDHEKSRNRFIENTTKKIKNILLGNDGLKEQAEAIQKINPISLSTKPAILAKRLSKNLNHLDILDQLQKNYAYMFQLDDHDEFEFPRNSKDWSLEEKKYLIEEAIKKSEYLVFKNHLKTHLTKHLSQILYPSTVGEFTTQIKSLMLDRQLEYSQNLQQQNLQSLRNKKLELYQVKEKLKSYLEAENAFIQSTLKTLHETLRNQAQPEQTVHTFEEKYKIQGKLAALSQWEAFVLNSFSNFVETLAEVLSKEYYVLDLREDEHLTSFELKNKIMVAINKLRSSGYSLEYINAESDFTYFKGNKDVELLKSLNISLNAFSEVIAEAAQQIIQNKFNLEKNRILDAMKFLQKTIATTILTESKKQIYSISVEPNFLLDTINSISIPQIAFKFESGFSVNRKEIKTKKIVESYEKVGQTRRWYTLFLIPEDVYDTVRREVIEKRTEDHAKIPNVDMLFDGFTSQFQHQWKNARYQYAQWLTNVLEELLSKIELYQNDILNQSAKLLMDMERSMQSQTEQEINLWKSLEFNINQLRQSLDQFMYDYQKKH